MASTGIGLNQPLIASGEARTFFFNGRLLAAEDLQREQTLREAGQRRLAQLFGCGIERGLVLGWSAGSSELTVSAGLGVTPSGALIDCGAFTLDLAAAAQAGPGGSFAACTAAFGGGGALAGLCLLVLTPAWIADGRAPTLLGEGGACNRNVELPAVRARLLPLNEPYHDGAVELRNRLAVALLAPLAGSAEHMLGWCPTTLAPTLGADDLPLAVLQINLKAQVEWADPEAARRRLSPPPGGAADALWPRSRRIEMEAFARQFTAQLLTNSASSADDFYFLPPVLVADEATRVRWEAVFGGLQQPHPQVPTLVSRERFVQALDGGLNDEPVQRGNAVLRVLALAQPDVLVVVPRWLLRLRNIADLNIGDEAPRP